MHFQQLNHLIPLMDRLESHSCSQTLHCPADCHLLIVVLRGHVTITAGSHEPAVLNFGYAGHPLHGPFRIDVPKTKKAEYAVITYRVWPAHSEWTLAGPLRAVSEVKIKYMLDELSRAETGGQEFSEDDLAAQQFRRRLQLERILYIFLYETQLKHDEHVSAASIEESLSYLNEHYMLKLALPLLAQRAGVSEGHYTVLFKKHTGTTMTAYLRSLRVKKAKEMFEQTRLSAKEIAQRVGFGDYFHFSRTFKQETGISPTEYQRGVSEI